MKIKSLFLLLPVLAVLICGCAEREPEVERGVVCTTYPVWLIVRDLMQGTENAPPFSLLVPADTGCPHDYAMTPGELLKLSRTRSLLLLRNGGGLDDQIATAARSVKPDLSDAPACDKCKGSHLHTGDEVCHANHPFTSPDTLYDMIARLTAALRKFDPDNADVYEANAEQLAKICADLTKRGSQPGLIGKKVLVMHSTFVPLVRLLKMDLRGVIFTGHVSELTPSALQDLISKIKAEQIGLLVLEPQTPEKLAKLLHQETGIKILRLDPLASGSMDVPNGYLLKNLEHNIQVLQEVQ